MKRFVSERRPHHTPPVARSSRRNPVGRLAVVLGLAGAASAVEVQRHGYVFEQWVRDTFFDGYRPAAYTQPWDIPAAANRAHGGVPVNPKATKYGSPVDLGDALRQFDIVDPFILVIGYWQQSGDAKQFVNVVAARIEPAQWRALWGPITRTDLEQLARVIADPTLTPAQARAAAQRIKRRPPFARAIMQVNPKIDSKTQRRLQCSLRFVDVFRHLAPTADAHPTAAPALWGVPVPPVPASPPRAHRAGFAPPDSYSSGGTPLENVRHHNSLQ